MPRKPRVPAERAVYDDRGNPIGQGRIDEGTFDREIDTDRLRRLKEEAARAIPSLPQPREPWRNPYNSSGAPRKKEKRRTLDDMRRLNEHVKRMKVLKAKSE